jgi:type 2 lantibiotic biosynthesis protein LanM
MEVLDDTWKELIAGLPIGAHVELIELVGRFKDRFGHFPKAPDLNLISNSDLRNDPFGILEKSKQVISDFGDLSSYISGVWSSSVESSITVQLLPFTNLPPKQLDAICSTFKSWSLRQLGRIAQQAFIFEVNRARLRTHFEIDLYQRYSLLLFLSSTLLQSQREFFVEFTSRLANDLPTIYEILGTCGPTVFQTEFVNSDLHRGGRSVIKVEFVTGHAVYYKPRTFSSERFITKLANEIGEPFDEMIPNFLDCGVYGYSLHVQQRAFESTEEVSEYYQAAGARTAAAFAIGLTDLHFENVIAGPTGPKFIDVETIFDPLLGKHEHETPEDRIARIGALSPLRTGALPGLMAAELSVTDLSGFGGVGEQLSPVKTRIASLNQAQMSSSTRVMTAKGNTPYLNKVPQKVEDFAPEFVAGFEEAITKISQNSNLLVRCFDGQNVESRIVLRQTVAYEKALEAICHPKRASCLEYAWIYLYLQLIQNGQESFVVENELKQLMSGDIPVYYGASGDITVRDWLGSAILKLADSGLNRALKRIEGLESNRAFLAAVVLSSLSSSASVRVNQTLRTSNSAVMTWANNQHEEFNSACIRRLSDESIEHNGFLSWPSLRPLKLDVYAATFSGPTFYDGAAGIGLYAATCARVHSNKVALSLAEQVYTGLVEHDNLYNGLGIGGYDGHAGIAFALAASPHLLSYKSLERINWIGGEVLHQLEAECTPCDLVSGAAGSLLVSCRLQNAEWVPVATRRIWAEVGAAAAGHIAEHVLVSGTGDVAWQPVDGLDIFPYGFAHGAAGIAYALREWALVSNCSTSFDLATRAMTREMKGYREDLLGWPDTRTGRMVNYWCYGASGILIALDSFKSDPKFSDAFHRGKLAANIKVTNHVGCLCHGELGNAHILGAANSLTRWSMDCGYALGFANPGLMTGYSGAGMQSLSSHFPTLTPNVLKLNWAIDSFRA